MEKTEKFAGKTRGLAGKTDDLARKHGSLVGWKTKMALLGKLGSRLGMLGNWLRN